MMKFLIVFIFSCVLFDACLAQNEIDSLNRIWSNERYEDSKRLEALNNLILDHYLNFKQDSALILSEIMLNYAQKKKNVKFQIEAQTLIGEIFFKKNESDKAINSYNKGLELAKTQKDSLTYAYKLFALGELFYNNNDYPNAFKVFQRSQNICKLAGYRIGESWSVGYLGLIYQSLGDWEEAEKHHLEHLKLSKQYDVKRGISGAMGNLGGTYENMGNTTKAIDYWKEGIKLAKELGLEAYASIGTSSLIRIYINEKQFSNAIKYLDEYKMVTKQFDSPYYPIRISMYQCQIEYGLGNYTDALRECENCYRLLQVDETTDKLTVFKNLYEVNKKLNNYAKALEFYEKYQILKESEKDDEAKTEIQRIVFNSQIVADSIVQAKEKQILNATYAEDLREKNREKNFLLVIGLLVLLLTAGLYHRLRFVRKSKAKLNIEKNKAEKSEQIKQDFLANMSHEIRTPMNAVMGMTNLVLDMPLEDKQRYYLTGIKNSGENLLHIINDILDLSKIEAGKMELDEIDFSIRDAVYQLKQMLQHRANEKDIALQTFVENEVDDIVIGDPMRLNQVLINLMGNAIKFTLKGSVTLEVRNVNEGVQFRVIDTGIGIPKDKLQKVFDSFSQASTSDTRKYGGTGLGLSISQQLVTMMHSTIKLDSKEGYGTTFSFIINFKKGSIDNYKLRISKDDIIDGSILDGLKILLVDDNEYNIIVARDTLKSKANLEIHEAYDGEEAIELLRNNQFDVVLMDVQMPVMNGFDATHIIRNKFESPVKDIPIIALTASVLRTDLDKCIDAGMNSYIPKPFKAHQLITEIAEVLNIPIKKRKQVSNLKPKPKIGDVTDLAYLNNFCEGDENCIKKYINLFTSSTPQLIEKINLALDQDDFEEIAIQTHSFKTKCMMMGMAETKDLANKVEQLCRENPDEKLIKTEVSNMFNHIDMALDELGNYINNS